MNPWPHVARVSSEIHEALMGWARALLQEAGLEAVEVYGQFPPQGTVAHHVVLFPYRLHPEPKVAENAPGASLLGPLDRSQDRVSFVPTAWISMGRALTGALELLFPDVGPLFGGRAAGRGPLPFPTLEAMPHAIRDWYLAQPEGDDETSWRFDHAGGQYARPPSLWWFPPITLTTRYIAVAGEPGRGTAERTSTGAPMGLPALSVLATGLHLERALQVRLPPLPFTPEIATYVNALAAGLDEHGAPAQRARAAELRSALAAVQAPDLYPVSVQPVHDLTNHEFALLMQALQRPLQPALNLCVRLPLGASAAFGPGAASHVRLRPPLRGPLTEAR